MDIKKKVLILGSKGMLGQELVKVFENDENYEMIAWDREKIDVTNLDDLKKQITDLWPDYIFNAVAYNTVDLCEEDDDEYEKAKMLNVKFPKELAKISHALQTVLVHYSTDYVFDGKRPVYKSGSGRAPSCCGQSCEGCQYMGADDTIDFFEYREEDKPNPLSKYGKTKLAGEKEVLKNNNQSYVIRLSKLFGKPAVSELGKESFFDVMLEKGKNGETLKVIDGEISKFTYAPDLALESKNIVEDDVSDYGIYHVVNEGAVTWYQGVLELFKLAGIDAEVAPVKSEDFSRLAKRANSSVLRVTKRKPLRDYREALVEFLEELK